MNTIVSIKSTRCRFQLLLAILPHAERASVSSWAVKISHAHEESLVLSCFVLCRDLFFVRTIPLSRSMHKYVCVCVCVHVIVVFLIRVVRY